MKHTHVKLTSPCMVHPTPTFFRNVNNESVLCHFSVVEGIIMIFSPTGNYHCILLVDLYKPIYILLVDLYKPIWWNTNNAWYHDNNNTIFFFFKQRAPLASSQSVMLFVTSIPLPCNLAQTAVPSIKGNHLTTKRCTCWVRH